MTLTFSTPQKLALAGMFVAPILLIVGLFPPYWLVSDVDVGGYPVDSDVVGFNMGIFMRCVNIISSGSECESLDPNEYGWVYVCMISGGICSFVGAICGIAALCLACCGKGTRFIALGVVCFIAAAVGTVAPIVFSKVHSTVTASILGAKFASFGWALCLYCAGLGLLGVVSIVACFSAPENPLGGLVFGQGAAVGPTVVVANQNQTSTQFFNQSPGTAAPGYGYPAYPPNFTPGFNTPGTAAPGYGYPANPPTSTPNTDAAIEMTPTDEKKY